MGASAESAPPPTVLIVDDNQDVRAVLAECVADLGLATAEARDGASALASARRAPPDLILLDVDMPSMNGRETLAVLKEDRALREIPVIMISGFDEVAVAVACIEAGADDFLTKPVVFPLLRARMWSSLDRARLRGLEKAYLRRMEGYGVELEQRVRQKTEELAEAQERLGILGRAKDEFLGLISHELRTPLTGVIGACDALTEGGLDDDTRKGAEALLRASVARLARTVEDALLLTRIKVSAEEFALVSRELGPIARAAAQRAAALAASHGVSVAQALEGAGRVLCDEPMLVEALASLYECAVKFSAPGQVVRVAGSRRAEVVELRIQAYGRGSIPAPAESRFFEILPFSPDPLTPGGDLGLGPAVAAHVLRLLGGSVEIEPMDNSVSLLVRLRAGTPTEA